MKRRGDRPLDDDEASLWAHVARGIRPLSGRLHQPPRPAAKPRQLEADGTKAAGPRAAPHRAPPPLAPLERRTRSALRRGVEPIDAVLDLHGLRQREALEALRAFLSGAQREHYKLVLVVTGKGGAETPHGERGVLKRMVPHWLRAPDMRAFVVGFEEAGHRHGGEGALYVRLRRRRGAALS